MEPYDDYEKELIASLENNEWKPVEQADKLRTQKQLLEALHKYLRASGPGGYE